MQPRWFLSQFFEDDAIGHRVPVCSAYGGTWFCPTLPADEDGWALVQMLASPHQIDAAAQDPRVIVCPLVFDPSPLPKQVTDAYASWGASEGMSLAALIAKLAATEPLFAHGIT
jgi:hypothetical protein